MNRQRLARIRPSFTWEPRNLATFLTAKTPIYTGPDKFLNGAKLARIRLLFNGIHGTGQVFKPQSVQVLYLIRSRSEFLTGTVPLLSGLVLTSNRASFCIVCDVKA